MLETAAMGPDFWCLRHAAGWLVVLFRIQAKRECSQPWGSLKTLAATCERHQLHFGGIHGMRENKFRCSIVRAQVRTENLEGKINRRTKKKRK